MSDPFKIDGPICISFSGGRTSAYMLWLIILAHGGTLPPDVVVVFANTGKEVEATLRFIRECARRWGVTIHWVEYRDDEQGFAIVDFDTASRAGEPFEALIRKRQYLPNPVTRFCTIELKIRAMAKFLVSIGIAETQTEGETMSIVGIRADEPRRAAKIADKSRIPLWAAGITIQDVEAFWNAQPFNLELTSVNGRTLDGNCDYCFNKPPAQRLALARTGLYPIGWWVRMEDGSVITKATGKGARFTKDGPSYAEIERFAREQREMFDYDEEAVPCFCGD